MLIRLPVMRAFLIPLGAMWVAGSGVMYAQATPVVIQSRVANIDVIVSRTPSDTLEILGTIAAGDVWSPSNNPVLGALVAKMLPRGTRQYDAAALTAALASVGAELGFDLHGHSSLGWRGRADRAVVEIRGRAPAGALPRVLALLAQELREPVFPAAELEELKRALQSLRSSRFETAANQAGRAWTRALYPEGHPNRWPTVEAIYDGIARTTVADLRAFHAAHYGPERLTLIVVGNVEASAVHEAVQASFGGWKGAKASVQRFKPVAGRTAATSDTILIPGSLDVEGRPQVVFYLGQATTLRYTDSDALALRLAAAILRQRLRATVNDTARKVVVLAQTSESMTRDLAWSVVGFVAPAQLDAVLVDVRREIAKWSSQGITTEEFEQGKAQLARSYTNFISPGTMLLYTVQQGYAPTWPTQGYPQALAALTLPQVNGALRKHVAPERMALAVAGAVGNTDPPKHYTLAGTVRATIDSAGAEPAIARYRELRAARFPDHYVSEVLLNELGYEYLEQGKLAAAIAVFRITVEQFPESSNAYDSLGEAYLKNGQRELARQNYQRSLDLDPGNENAAKVLAQLRTNN